MSTPDTIVALSTSHGRSAIGVIRLSGARALEIARLLVADNRFAPAPNHVTLKNLRAPETGEVLDRALVTYFKAPQSFTGEDVVEISCHGSPVLLRQVIDITLRLGARAADAGEFTLRALANGRMNLSQAEAVRDLINAQTSAAVRQAARQLGGELSARLQPIKNALLDIIVPLESALEFVEDDLPEVAFENLCTQLSSLIHSIEKLASTFRAGRLLRDGIKVTLGGRPNVGKSSIFNALLVAERAIVTDVPGTTRDSLSELLSIQGVPVLLTDTAGLRASTDEIEILGVERTRRALSDADLIVLVLDGSQPPAAEDEQLIAEIRGREYLIALNKSDLDSFTFDGFECAKNQQRNILPISARTGAGLDNLRTAILERFVGAESPEAGLLITDARHFDLLQRATNALCSSVQLLQQRASEELILVGLYDALRLLGEITGETTPEDILTQIFATFCIGK